MGLYICAEGWYRKEYIIMKSSNANKHLTLEDRKIIENGIRNGSSKTAIAETLGKDKSTIGKEIKLHRQLKHKCSLAMECSVYKSCKLGRSCKPTCSNYIKFTCKKRDKSPGACNGCSNINSCHFDHYFYVPDVAYSDYKNKLLQEKALTFLKKILYLTEI